MRSPSSLIFLVLLGVWAAYFAQYWLRRRDHLATARSVDQFTEAMRVLERRPSLPRTDLSEPAPRSYAVHAPRAARPQVLVKRAVAAEPAATGVSARVPSETTPPRREAAAASPGGPSARSARDVAPAPRMRPRGSSRVRPSRRIRGLVLLVALAELVAIVTGVGLSLVPMWALAPAVLAVVWSFGWVRSAVRAEQAGARVRHRRAARMASSSDAPGADRLRGPRAEDRSGSTAVVESGGTPVAPAAGDEDAEAGEGRPAMAGPAPADEVMVPIVDEDDIPLTWDPVPVPRPTYTMKAKAERPEVAPAAVTPDPAPVRQEAVGDGTAYDQRRAAGA